MGTASADADREGRKLFLGGLAYECNEDDLRADFGKYGDLEDVQLPMGEGGRHKGFAFITYRSPDDASFASKEHHQREYRGREISAKIVVPRAERGGDVRPGDWTCPSCGANVFASKRACFKCQTPKPGDDGGYGGGGGGYGGGWGGGGGGGYGGGGYGGGGPPPRDGDWTCPSCGANVFASKMECYKCRCPKP